MSAPGWTLYLLRNERGALYTGITTDLQRRMREHRGELRGAARYTRACKTLELVYNCRIGPRGLALQAERRVKSLAKTSKEELVATSPGRAGLLAFLELSG